MDFFSEWDEASWHFTYVDEDQQDKFTLQGGLVVVFYLDKSYLPERRQAMAAIMTQFNELYGQHLKWGYTEKPAETRYSASSFAKSVEYMRTQAIFNSVELTWSSGAGYDFVGSYGFDTLSRQDWYEQVHNSLSYIRFYLPVEILKNNGRAEFEALIYGWAAKLKPLHGYAGLGLQQGCEFSRYENLEFENAELFKGLEVASCFGRKELRDGIKSINWYTFLDDSWLPKLGGQTQLEANLAAAEAGLSLKSYPGGVMIKAGEWPALGWVERDPWPSAYVAVNRILKPVRVPELKCLHFGSILGEARFTPALSQVWLKRFDRPEDDIVPLRPLAQPEPTVLYGRPKKQDD